MIPYGRQTISQEDIDAVVGVLKSDFITQGSVVPAFEKAISRYCGAKFSLAMNSATSALFVACKALDLSEGDWLWTSPISFVASANCGLHCGAKVDFVDIDPKTYNMCPVALKNKLEKSKKSGKLPKVVVPVHLSGLPCDMESIYALSLEYKFSIIEDASHAIGGSYKNRKIGACEYSDFTVFSFHPVKIITTGEGGMLLTNHKRLASQAALIASHGITRDQNQMSREPEGSWYYQMITLGYNFRMSDIHAALGLSQFQRLDKFVKRRHEIANYYDHALTKLPLQLPRRSDESYSGLHLYIVCLQSAQDTNQHKGIFESLRNLGIGVNLHYIPIHTHPYYESKGFQPSDFPQAMHYYKTAFSLPMYPGLKDEQLEKVARCLKEVLR